MKLFRYLILSALLGVVVVAQAADPPWFTRHLVGLEVGPTGAQFGHSDSNDVRYAARFDGREIVRRSVAAHSEYLVLWVRDGDYAYYDSKLLPKAPGLGARDPLREAMDEARQHKLPVSSYCVVQQGGHFLKAHPGLEMRGADGKPIGRFCFNSGYLEAMKGIVAEQLAYGIDGFHIDMLDQGFGPPYGCWCGTCQGEFQKQFARAMPKGATWDEDWDRMLEFRYATSDRFEKVLTAHIKSINSRATVDFTPGNSLSLFELDGVPATAIICHERRYPELVRLPVMAGAQIVFHLNAGMDDLAVSLAKHRGLDGIPVRAFENAVFYVFANSVGPQGEGKWSAGDVKIVAPDGSFLQLAENRRESLLVQDIDLSLATRKYALDSLKHPRFLASHWRRMLPEIRRRVRETDQMFQRWFDSKRSASVS